MLQAERDDWNVSYELGDTWKNARKIKLKNSSLFKIDILVYPEFSFKNVIITKHRPIHSLHSSHYAPLEAQYPLLWDDNKEKSGVHYCPELLSGMTFLPVINGLSI